MKHQTESGSVAGFNRYRQRQDSGLSSHLLRVRPAVSRPCAMRKGSNVSLERMSKLLGFAGSAQPTALKLSGSINRAETKKGCPMVELQNVPGYQPSSLRQYWYIRQGKRADFNKLLKGLIRFETKQLPESGSVMDCKFQIETAGAHTYFCLSISGDVGGWKRLIEEVERFHGRTVDWGYIQHDFFMTETNAFPLHSCSLTPLTKD